MRLEDQDRRRGAGIQGALLLNSKGLEARSARRPAPVELGGVAAVLSCSASGTQHTTCPARSMSSSTALLATSNAFTKVAAR